MKTSTIALYIIIGGLIFAGVMAYRFGLLTAQPSARQQGTENNVTEENGVQKIIIYAKGGYSPRITKAKSGLPTTLIMRTDGTFDCSIAFTIPSLGIRQNLPQTGDTSFTIPPQQKGASIQGLCSMGMYNFTIQFE